jgi:hypothetical protein
MLQACNAHSQQQQEGARGALCFKTQIWGGRTHGAATGGGIAVDRVGWRRTTPPHDSSSCWLAVLLLCGGTGDPRRSECCDESTETSCGRALRGRGCCWMPHHLPASFHKQCPPAGCALRLAQLRSTKARGCGAHPAASQVLHEDTLGTAWSSCQVVLPRWGCSPGRHAHGPLHYLFRLFRLQKGHHLRQEWISSYLCGLPPFLPVFTPRLRDHRPHSTHN